MKTVYNTRKRKRNRKQKTRKTYKPHQKHIKKNSGKIKNMVVNLMGFDSLIVSQIHRCMN